MEEQEHKTMIKSVNYKAILGYFRLLAATHAQIRSFVGYSPFDLSSKAGAVRGLCTPALVLYGYEGKLDGNHQRTVARRTLRFAVVHTVLHAHDFQAQYETISMSEAIGLSVLSRLNIESKKGDIKWLHNSFVKESVRFNEIKLKGENGMFGMEFSFDIKTLEPLVINPSDWKDIEII